MGDTIVFLLPGDHTRGAIPNQSTCAAS